ncbi:uncharacterized protein LOC134259329 [Saccostrea cucullata]|uniref:uncharacterized protein LOC134259329 n=1 Tax=Saccostrea cuccullata TaxID=36930 RepID=UPI002ED307C9
MSWAERERNKDCQSVQQNCTIPEKFRYHCVVNEWRNATLELCAPVRNIVDQCAEYNIGAHQIQYNRQNCTKFSTPCPHLYKSNKVYKYPDCFKLKSPPHNSTIDDHRNRVNVLNISWLDDSEKHISGITQIYSSRLTFLIAFVTAYYQSTF